jgi:hypothetical protein
MCLYYIEMVVRVRIRFRVMIRIRIMVGIVGWMIRWIHRRNERNVTERNERSDVRSVRVCM